MELREAIIQAISLRGVEILTNVKLINILTDLHAFNSLTKAHKNVLTAILEDELLENAIEASDQRQKEFEIEEVRNKLENDYGYSPKIIVYLLNEIGSALGLNVSSVQKPEQTLVEKPQSKISFNGYKVVLSKSGTMWHLKDKTGTELQSYNRELYEVVEPYQEGYVLVRSFDMWGILNLYLDLIIPFEYENKQDCIDAASTLPAFDMATYNDDRYLSDTWPDYVSDYLAPHGVIDKRTGKVIIKPKFDNSLYFKRGMARASVDGNMYGFIDRTGSYVIPPIFEDVPFSIDDVSAVKLNGKYGYIDTQGKFLIDCKYSDASGFVYGMAVVQDTNGKYGVIDKKGNVVIPCTYDYISGGIRLTKRHIYMLCAKKGNKYGFIDKDNNVVIDFIYDDANYIRDELIRVKLNGMYGFIDIYGNTVIENKYRGAKDFSCGYAFVQNYTNKWGVIDKQGNVVLPFRYDKAEFDFSEDEKGIITGEVVLNGSCFYIDPTGRVVEVIY